MKVNPQRSCTARVVCVSPICLFVTSYSGTTGYKVAHEQYQWLQNYDSQISSCLPRPGFSSA